MREAESYQEKGDGHIRNAEYAFNRAESYLRDVAYYIKNDNPGKAESYASWASDQMDKYRTQMGYAADAYEKAAYYMRLSKDMLSKIRD